MPRARTYVALTYSFNRKQHNYVLMNIEYLILISNTTHCQLWLTWEPTLAKQRQRHFHGKEKIHIAFSIWNSFKYSVRTSDRGPGHICSIIKYENGAYLITAAVNWNLFVVFKIVLAFFFSFRVLFEQETTVADARIHYLDNIQLNSSH